MKLAIIAGGAGTRLGLKNIPKPMVKVAGTPLLEHQINLAKSYGIKDIYILSGHMSDVITGYFGDGSNFGVNIKHVVERSPLGTAGAVKQLEGIVQGRFMVIYGDVVLDMDLGSFIGADDPSSMATIVVHPNDHPHDSDLLEINEENIVSGFYPKPHKEGEYHRNLVNAAVYILGAGIFKYIPTDTPSDFGKDIFPMLLRYGEKISAYKTAEYVKDLGTVERLNRVSDDMKSGKVMRLSKRYKRKAIFIDRDGTLIRDIDLLHCAEDLDLFPFSVSAIRKINDSDFLSFLITNQPVVARNLCDIPAVREIHNKLESLLGREGAYLNDIYFCPHHPDRGYPEENKEFKIECDCRKPKTGMVERAAAEYNVDVKSSWVIGDTTADVQTGINAGLKTVLVRTGKAGQDGKFNVNPDFEFDNISDAVDYILYGRVR